MICQQTQIGMHNQRYFLSTLLESSVYNYAKLNLLNLSHNMQE